MAMVPVYPFTRGRRQSGHALAGSPALGVAPRRRSVPPLSPALGAVPRAARSGRHRLLLPPALGAAPLAGAQLRPSRQRSALSRAPPGLAATASCSHQCSAPSRAPPALAVAASCSRHRDEAASVLTSLWPASVPIQSHCRG
ncbi:hypothetical protein GUJ93_ZPchr0011g27154 [Zizania palustris]|uniref:Uncharacterized protein n=1 Tax=Zizania palustris TaxID=103762 RepID=A0A8J5WLD9_ZIZPA|nr:hypothetical protein GUJ93_ZPchr0011g27154 [Zizania palustris]